MCRVKIRAVVVLTALARRESVLQALPILYRGRRESDVCLFSSDPFSRFERISHFHEGLMVSRKTRMGELVAAVRTVAEILIGWLVRRLMR